MRLKATRVIVAAQVLLAGLAGCTASEPPFVGPTETTVSAEASPAPAPDTEPEQPATCTIFPAVEPTSILIVPVEVIVPATSPVPVVTPVTVPEVTLAGCHCDPFHNSTWFGLAPVATRLVPCSFTASFKRAASFGASSETWNFGRLYSST
jgi:hypothetical protein